MYYEEKLKVADDDTEHGSYIARCIRALKTGDKP